MGLLFEISILSQFLCLFNFQKVEDQSLRSDLFNFSVFDGTPALFAGLMFLHRNLERFRFFVTFLRSI